MPHGSVWLSRISWMLLVDLLALRQQLVELAWPQTLRSVVCASCEVAKR